MTEKIKDFTARLRVTASSDVLDFMRTGTGVFILEDGVGELPLPQGEPGAAGWTLPVDALVSFDSELEREAASRKVKSNYRQSGIALFNVTDRSLHVFNPSRQEWSEQKAALTDFNQAQLSVGATQGPLVFENLQERPKTGDYLGSCILYCYKDSLIFRNSKGNERHIG